jgi:hypothetical protein
MWEVPIEGCHLTKVREWKEEREGEELRIVEKAEEVEEN